MMRRARFTRAESGVEVCIASIADTFLTRFTGLQGRRGLAQDAGMWIVPTRCIHTFGMRFAIDAVALDCELQVLEVCEALQPWRVAAFAVTPHSVLELAAGRSRSAGLRLGERLRMVRTTL